MLVLEKKHKHFTIDDTTDGREDISQPNDCFFIVPYFIDHIQAIVTQIFVSTTSKIAFLRFKYPTKL